MRVVVGLLLLLLGLCGSGAQGEAGGLSEVAEIDEKTDLKDAAEDSTELNTEQTYPDIWTELRDMVVELRGHVELLQRENLDLQSRLSSSESRTDQLERLNAENQRSSTKVAFYAALTNAGRLGPYNTDITLKFSKVVTNIGYAYSPSTGFFTAPVRGVYSFQFTVCGDYTGHIGVEVYKNSQKIMYNWERNDNVTPEYFTNSLVLQLSARDEIHLVLPSGFRIYDDINNYSTFSGSLLFTL